jgi:hypothetical protein
MPRPWRADVGTPNLEDLDTGCARPHNSGPWNPDAAPLIGDTSFPPRGCGEGWYTREGSGNHDGGAA